MAVESKATTTAIGKMVLLAIIGVIAGAFCAKDGFFAPDVEIGEVTAFSEEGGAMKATLKLEGAKLKVGDTVTFAADPEPFSQTVESIAVEGEKVGESVADKELTLEVKREVAPGDKVLTSYQHKSFNQVAAVLFGAAAVYALARIVWLATLRIETSDEGLSFRGGESIPWAAFKEADVSKLKKGILRLNYETDGRSGTITLDDVKHTNFIGLVGDVNAHTPLDIKLPASSAAGSKEPEEDPEAGEREDGTGGESG
jgi:hypothetical protein